MLASLSIPDVKSDKRNMFSTDLPEDVLDAIDSTSKRFGYKKKEYMTRLLKWFHSQDEAVQHAILSGLRGKAASSLVRSAVEALGKEPSPKNTKLNS